MNAIRKFRVQRLISGGLSPKEAYNAVKGLKLRGYRKTDGNVEAQAKQKEKRAARKARKSYFKTIKEAARNKYISQMMAVYKVRFQTKSEEKKNLRDRYGKAE
jgi:hypothetical protein